MNLPGRGNYRYYLVTILSVTWMIIYLQRTNIGMLLVDNRFLENMNLLGQPAQQGLLMTVFLLAYSLANILLVSISNRLGPRRTLMWGIVVGSMILMLGGWAATFAAIIAVRLLLGITHGIQYPNLSVLVKNWFPPHERGTANAIYAMGGCIGPALAIPLYGWLNQSWGWEYSFFVPAALGLACVIPFFLKWVSDQPGDNSYISDKEVRYIVKKELAQKGIELYDIKFEFGRVGEDKHIALIDEISGGNMRAFKDGRQLQPLELEKIMLGAN